MRIMSWKWAKGGKASPLRRGRRAEYQAGELPRSMDQARRAARRCGVISCVGSTSSHRTEPAAQRAAASRNDAVQPKCSATSGVSQAVTQLPICPPIFMTPEADPDEEPAISAVTAQKELCERYSAP